MGVKGLWPLLEPAARPTSLESLEGKRLAVDASIWLHQFVKAMRDREGNALPNAHVVGFLRRICKLLFYGIKPVFVFDGSTPELKRKTVAGRRERRERLQDSAKKTAAKILSARLKLAALGNTTETGQTPSPLTAEPLSGAKRKRDAYDLDVPANAPARLQASNQHDPRLALRSELEGFVEEHKEAVIDIDSDVFQALPIELQHEIILDLKNKSRQTSWELLEEMTRLAPTGIEFSQLQIDNLVRRNDLMQKYMAISGMGHRAASLQPSRIAGERSREYILVRNDDAAVGGWTMGATDENAAADAVVPLGHAAATGQSDATSHGSSKPSDDEFEEVPVDNLPVAATSLPLEAPPALDARDISPPETISISDLPPNHANFQSPPVYNAVVTISEATSDEEEDIEADEKVQDAIAWREIQDWSGQGAPVGNESLAPTVPSPELISASDTIRPGPTPPVEPTPILAHLPSPRPTIMASVAPPAPPLSPSHQNNRPIESISLPKAQEVDWSALMQASVLQPAQPFSARPAELTVALADTKPTRPVATPTTSPQRPPPSSLVTTLTPSPKRPSPARMRHQLVTDIAALRQARNKADRQASALDNEMVADVQQLLMLFGIPFVTAPSEAEAECAFLDEAQAVDGVVTDDNDVFLFGATRVYRHLFNQTQSVEYYQSADLRQELVLDQETLIQLAYLLGSDYTDGVHGVGLVSAMEIVHLWPSLAGLQDFKAWWDACTSPLADTKTLVGTGPHAASRRRLCKLAQKVPLPSGFPDPQVALAYQQPQVSQDAHATFVWGFPDLDALRDYLADKLGWDQVKADQLLLPIVQNMHRKSATMAATTRREQPATLLDFFSPAISSATAAGLPLGQRSVIPGHKSERIRQIIADWKQARDLAATIVSDEISPSSSQARARSGEGGFAQTQQSLSKSLTAAGSDNYSTPSDSSASDDEANGHQDSMGFKPVSRRQRVATRQRTTTRRAAKPGHRPRARR
ncbi:DNA repair protein rad2 [Dimargaris xerosporica]|nr:DNA repair protein rad2 [Dimargaris xerosporica]